MRLKIVQELSFSLVLMKYTYEMQDLISGGKCCHFVSKY